MYIGLPTASFIAESVESGVKHHKPTINHISELLYAQYLDNCIIACSIFSQLHCCAVSSTIKTDNQLYHIILYRVHLA
jgi:hypothetical protein